MVLLYSINCTDTLIKQARGTLVCSAEIIKTVSPYVHTLACGLSNGHILFSKLTVENLDFVALVEKGLEKIDLKTHRSLFELAVSTRPISKQGHPIISIEKTGNKFVVIIDKGGTIAVVKENRKPVTKGQIDLSYMASVPDPTSKIQVFPPIDMPQNVQFNVFEEYKEDDP